MPEILLLIGSCLIVASLFWRRFTSSVKRRRDSRHIYNIQRGIAEYLALKSIGKRITKNRLATES
jgi:hypothetical protein